MNLSLALLLAITALIACYLAFQVFRVVESVQRAHRNIEAAKVSGDHPAAIRLFVETQTKLMQLDIKMGIMFASGLAPVLLLAWKAVGLLRGA